MDDATTKNTMLQKLKDISGIDGWVIDDSEDEAELNGSLLKSSHHSSAIMNAGDLDEEDDEPRLYFRLPQPYDEEKLALFESTIKALDMDECSLLANDTRVTFNAPKESLDGFNDTMSAYYGHYLAKLKADTGVVGTQVISIGEEGDVVEYEYLLIKIPKTADDPELKNLSRMFNKIGIRFTLKEENDTHILKINSAAIEAMGPKRLTENNSIATNDLADGLKKFTGIEWKESYRFDEECWGFMPLDHLNATQQAALENSLQTLGIKLGEFNNGAGNNFWLDRADASDIHKELSSTRHYLGTITPASTKQIE